MTVSDPAEGKESSLAWGDIAAIVPFNYFGRSHVIELLSGSIVSGESGVHLPLEAVTAGYRHLVRIVRRRLGLPIPVHEHRLPYNFVVFESRSVLATLIVSLLAGIGFVVVGKVHPLYGVLDPKTHAPDLSKAVFTPIFGVLFGMVPMALLLGSAVILWRAATHQHLVSRLYRRARPSMPTWLIGLGALLLTLATVAWFVVLLTRTGN